MPQPNLEYISLAIAKKIGDEVLNMSADMNGNLFTSAQRLNAINGARQNIYDATYNTLNPENFGEMYPEFIRESSDLPIINNIGSIPDDTKYIYSVRIRTTDVSDEITNPSKEAKKIPKELSYEAQYDTYSVFKADANNYKYIEQNTQLKILGSTITNGLLNLIYLADITPVELGDDADIPDPYSWRQKTIDEATRILLTDQQIV